MFETRCFKVKLKPGSIERVREWAEAINARRDEAIDSLKEETVVVESVFLDRTDEGDFLIGYMKAVSFEKNREAAQKSVREIDAYHRQFKQETWAEHKELERLVDLERIVEA